MKSTLKAELAPVRGDIGLTLQFFYVSSFFENMNKLDNKTSWIFGQDSKAIHVQFFIIMCVDYSVIDFRDIQMYNAP